MIDTKNQLNTYLLIYQLQYSTYYFRQDVFKFTIVFLKFWNKNHKQHKVNLLFIVATTKNNFVRDYQQNLIHICYCSIMYLWQIIPKKFFNLKYKFIKTSVKKITIKRKQDFNEITNLITLFRGWHNFCCE